MPILYEGRDTHYKNISIIDEKGNTYEATYPKRARGLVKNGRARFVDENTICLACPPNIDLEDNIMNKDILNPDKLRRSPVKGDNQPTGVKTAGKDVRRHEA